MDNDSQFSFSILYKKAGNNMKKMVNIVRLHLQSWLYNYTIWAGFGIGFGLCMIYVFRFISLCNAMGATCQIVEPYIIMGNMSKHSFTGIFLGCMVVLSDVPFINKQSPYEILRVGTRTWLRSQIAYIFIATLLYNFVIFIICVTLGIAKSNVCFDNKWSNVMTLLAVRQPTFAVSNFKVFFPYEDFIAAVTPYIGALLTLLFNSAYCIIVVLLMFIINIWSKTNIGWIASAAVHILGYVISNNRNIFFDFNISLLECAFPATLFSKDAPLGPFWAGWYLLTLLLVLTEISQKSHQRLVV